jgi:ABC-2 type transport system ATP-binding protein
MSTDREAVVAITALVKRYGDFDAVAGIDLDVRRGEVFGFLGPNGAGKTTTLECVVGLRTPTSGAVSVLGFDPARDRDQITSLVAVQPQSASLLETLTVFETMRLFASFHENAQDAVAVLDLVGLTDQKHVRTKNLSGGQLRRLLVGVALVGSPEIVVLDEPSAGLDPAARQKLWSVISGLRERGTTVLLSTHDMDEATALCDRVAILVAGRLVALDSPDELIRQGSAESTVTFTVPPGTDLAALTTFTAEAAVEHHDVRDGIRVTIVTGDPDDLLRKVTFIPSLRAREFSVHRGSLEDIFLQLADDTDARQPTTARREGQSAA